MARNCVISINVLGFINYTVDTVELLSVIESEQGLRCPGQPDVPEDPFYAVFTGLPEGSGNHRITLVNYTRFPLLSTAGDNKPV